MDLTPSCEGSSKDAEAGLSETQPTLSHLCFCKLSVTHIAVRNSSVHIGSPS